MKLLEKFSQFRKKYESRLELGFFVAGFVFDAWMVSYPDELLVIFQQAFYLFLIALFIHFELLFRHKKWQPQKFVLKIWPYRNLALHFFLGTLLNVYSIFYIKSASLMSSIVFLILMLGMILVNELPIVKESEKVYLKVALYAICLFSFLSIVFPIIFGFIGFIPFAFSVIFMLGILFIQLKLLAKTIQDTRVLSKAIFAPVVSVIVVFALFFFLGLIPPVPLSVKEQGIYHLIEKQENKYLLSTENTGFRLWPLLGSVFHAESGDKIYFYAQIYSPARISDEIVVHWFKVDSSGQWLSQDKVPVAIRGGREEGYRIYTYKTNYDPGNWKIEVETSSGVEISRLYFEVIATVKDESRKFIVLER